MKYLTLMLIALMALSSVSPGLDGGETTDLNREFADIAWGWREDAVGPLNRMEGWRSAYDIQIVKPHQGGVEIGILLSGKQVYKWKGNDYSVFQIVGDRIYYADYAQYRSGGAVVSADLKTGKEIWRSPLLALGPIQHSGYLNLLNLRVERGAVIIFAWESAGRYIELKDAETGTTVMHRVLPNLQNKEPENQDASAFWQWHDGDASALAGAGRGDYDIVLLQRHDQCALDIQVMRAGKQVYSWEGNPFSVYCIVDHRMYYVDFNPKASGGDVVAIDLDIGREIWRAKLMALDTRRHGSNYSARFNLDVPNPGVIVIIGNETDGRYIESLDAENGKMLRHKTFND